MQTSNKEQKTFNDLLQAIDVVNVALDDAKTKREFAAAANDALRYLSRRMGLTKRQCVILSIVVESSSCYSIGISQIARDMHLSMTGMLRYKSDLDTLEERGYIARRKDNNSICYRMPLDVLESFQRDEVYVDPCMNVEKLSFDQLFEQISILFDRRDHEEMSYSGLCLKIQTLINNNKHLEFAKQVAAMDCDINDKILLLFFCHRLVNEDDDEIGQYQLSDIYERNDLSAIKRDLALGHNELQENGIIEFCCSDGHVDRWQYRLTDKAKQQLLAEANLTTSEYKAGLTAHTEIVAKELFYNDEDEAQITNLSGLLTEENYQNVRRRLEEKGMRMGFACLFYGGPGTGKTETVLQLAKRTGRDIMQVDISQMRSKWVGESEKNIKAVFDQYRKAVSKNKLAPILFFNEADALLNKRQEGAQHSVDKMENTMQNIILEELEKLDGIFIATTNLANNLDPAFERRFLFKVKFHKPTPEVRSKIWKTMLPDVAEEQLILLAEEFDLSGGQIENIARHYAINSVLYGSNSFDDLRSFCSNERIAGRQQQSRRRVGFA